MIESPYNSLNKRDDLRLTLDEYSKQFKMSKEMINSKLKAKKLNYVIEDGVTLIMIDKEEIEAPLLVEPSKEVIKNLPVQSKQRTTVATILSLYQKENQQLKDKIIQLENKIDKLIDDKEQMLRDERDKIEEVYSKKDVQLKNILELINTKLTAEQEPQTIHEIESYEQKNEIVAKEPSHLQELKTYIKNLDLKSHQKKIIKKRFLTAYDNDVRIIQQNGKLYLDFSKYDYSDLLAH